MHPTILDAGCLSFNARIKAQRRALQKAPVSGSNWQLSAESGFEAAQWQLGKGVEIRE